MTVGSGAPLCHDLLNKPLEFLGQYFPGLRVGLFQGKIDTAVMTKLAEGFVFGSATAIIPSAESPGLSDSRLSVTTSGSGPPMTCSAMAK